MSGSLTTTPGPAPVEQGRWSAPLSQSRSYCAVVAIGDRGEYRPALQLAAREAKHTGLAVKLVHGSAASSELITNALHAAGCARRGRRLLDAAVDELRTLTDDHVMIDTSNVALTGVDALLEESLTAPLIVLQRTGTPGGAGRVPGSTMSAVAAWACCPVVLAPSGHARRVSTGLRLSVDNRDLAALTQSPQWAEAGLRRVPLTITHTWDGPSSRTLTSAHLPPSQKEPHEDRAADLRRLAAMVVAMEDATTIARPC